MALGEGGPARINTRSFLKSFRSQTHPKLQLNFTPNMPPQSVAVFGFFATLTTSLRHAFTLCHAHHLAQARFRFTSRPHDAVLCCGSVDGGLPLNAPIPCSPPTTRVAVMMMCSLLMAAVLKNGKTFVSEEEEGACACPRPRALNARENHTISFSNLLRFWHQTTTCALPIAPPSYPLPFEVEFVARCREFAASHQPGSAPPLPRRTFQAHWDQLMEPQWKWSFFLFTLSILRRMPSRPSPSYYFVLASSLCLSTPAVQSSL